mmetsp:Transcript_50040/g.89421  ORF Transcript_50040/g.89421 Transcript_50040/m.89421 type:complete len:103 (-) Transcript_50040:143-451(-)
MPTPPSWALSITSPPQCTWQGGQREGLEGAGGPFEASLKKLDECKQPKGGHHGWAYQLLSSPAGEGVGIGWSGCGQALVTLGQLGTGGLPPYPQTAPSPSPV